MKKKKGVLIFLLFILFISIMGILFVVKKEKTFYLEDSYYETNKMEEIEIDKLTELINNKKSFAVFIYQPMCVTSSNFESVLSSFLEENKISIYKVKFSSIKDTKLGKYVKFYPSFAIYNKGKLADFLEATKNEDVDYYTSKEGFKDWFTKYVKLKNED